MCLVMAGIQLPMSSLYDPARGGGGGGGEQFCCMCVLVLHAYVGGALCSFVSCVFLLCLPYPRASGIKETMATSD